MKHLEVKDFETLSTIPVYLSIARFRRFQLFLDLRLNDDKKYEDYLMAILLKYDI